VSEREEGGRFGERTGEREDIGSERKKSDIPSELTFWPGTEKYLRSLEQYEESRRRS
jgi:hypothetical protein